MRETRDQKGGWVQVRCPRCGRYLCEVRVGSAVKVACKRCKTVVVRDVTAGVASKASMPSTAPG